MSPKGITPCDVQPVGGGNHHLWNILVETGVEFNQSFICKCQFRKYRGQWELLNDAMECNKQNANDRKLWDQQLGIFNKLNVRKRGEGG